MSRSNSSWQDPSWIAQVLASIIAPVWDSAFNQCGAPWDRVLAKSSAADFPTKGLHG
jgi:hypothetical protein